ncbi:hypothetical protein TNCV_278951 [Trichonephila clavipes]|nr:hypothetical protein TNCV_278951 [Trichonephila clavipes]
MNLLTEPCCTDSKPKQPVFRLCIDYRKLNEVTVLLILTHFRECADLLQEAKHTAYISTIDLKSGYHQVNVNPADRYKTAFVCPFGMYRFKMMPFGLKNAPASFQRLMDIFPKRVTCTRIPR